MIYSEISNCILNSISTILFLPLWVSLMILLNLAIPLINSKKFTLNITLGTGIVSLLFAIISLIHCVKNPNTCIENNILWLESTIKVHLGTLIDNFSSVLLLFVSGLAIFIQIFSYYKLKENRNFHKFYILLNLLNFSLFGLILSSNVIQVFIFIMLVSVCVYLLMTIFSTEENISNGKKLFLINNIADIGLFVGGLHLIYFASVFNSTENLVLLSFSNLNFNIDNLYSMLPIENYSIIVLFILLCIVIKLGQFPFICSVLKTSSSTFIVSSIISVFALGASGVYILARFYPMIILSDFILNLMVIIGGISALLGAYFAMSQNNLRKLLSCICVSQYGIILVLFGVKAYSTAILSFVCFGFAYFLLSLTSALISDEIDIKNIGGERKRNPFLATLFAIGCLSICGVLFSGFYTNHFIFSSIYNWGNDSLIVIYLIVLFLTVFSLCRAYFLVFEGENNAKDINNKIYSTKQVLVTALLAILVVIFGYSTKTSFYNVVYFIAVEKFIYLPTIPFIVQLFVLWSAIYISFNLYVVQNNTFMKIKESALNKNNLIYKLSYNCFYLENVCKWGQKKIVSNLFRPFNFIEKTFIAGINDFVSSINKFISYLSLKLNKNNTKFYIICSILLFVFVVFVVLVMFLMGV